MNSSNRLITTFAGFTTTNLTGDLPAIGDFDGDGKDDLAIQNQRGELYIKLGTDTGMTGTQFWGMRPTESTNGLALGDYNGDDRTDLAYFSITDLAMDTLLSTGTTFLTNDFGFGSLKNETHQLFTGEFGD